MRYLEGEMVDQNPETEKPKSNPHREYLVRRNSARLAKVRSGELPPEQLAAEWADREIALEDQADHDSLTGLLNYQGFADALTADLMIIQLYNIPAYLGFFDGDKLKKINDTIGKLAGNQVIQSYAKTMRQIEALHTDIPFLMGRFGGDEFMLLVIGVDIKAAKAIFEEVRTTIPDRVKSSLNMPDLENTVSMGVVTIQPNDNAQTLLRRADDQLKIAKMERNKVVFEGLPLL
ncbi:GGDEF domain-containing protein [Candidatus Daviesbacteria bacterium]|nr:GGDEF domain-containing protein [Candidatus Daviesbacteria bacterium]